jgi:hypothetical protein
VPHKLSAPPIEVTTTRADGRFVHTVELRVDTATERELRLRFEVARKIYNALLGEAFRRIRRVEHELRRKEHVALRAACTAKAKEQIAQAGVRADSDEAKAIRKQAYKPYNEIRIALERKNYCSAYGLQSHGKVYGTQLSQNTPLWAPGHSIGATICVQLSKRAWFAAKSAWQAMNTNKQRRKHKHRKHRRDTTRTHDQQQVTPKMVRYNEMMSVESMNNHDAIHVVGDRVIWSSGICKAPLCTRAEHPQCAGGTIAMTMRLDKTGRDIVERHARTCDIVQTRILRKRIRGQWRYFAQLVLAGTPAERPWLSEGAHTGTLGLDLGLNIVAVDSDAHSAIYAHSATESAQAQAQRLRRLRRALDRSRRATNPHCFDAKGRWIKGKRITRVSRTYRKLRAQQAEIERVIREERNNATKTLANFVARLGDKVFIEKLDYVTMAQRYGYSSKGMAPGAFHNALRHRVESMNHVLYEIPAHKAKLSQYCHECGNYEPRRFPVSVLERRQRCSRCGDHGVQADLYQAFLARFVRDEGTVDPIRARKAWSGARKRLAEAGSAVNNAAKIVSGLSSRARDRAALEQRASESRIGSVQGPASDRSLGTHGVETAAYNRRAPRWGEPHAGPLDKRIIAKTATKCDRGASAERRDTRTVAGARNEARKASVDAAVRRKPSQ